MVPSGATAMPLNTTFSTVANSGHQLFQWNGVGAERLLQLGRECIYRPGRLYLPG